MNGVESNGQTASSQKGTQVPEWLNAEFFAGVLKEHLPNYKQLKDFKAFPALAPGENYATLMLRIEVVVELQDDKTKALSYMMKVPLDIPLFNEMMRKHNIFAIEQDMYNEIVPSFEQMFRAVGVEVCFGAKSYNAKGPCEFGVILLEDLRERGFKNANRLEGLDMEHTKCVLKKLAQWHAASAVRFETKGKYDDAYVIGLFNRDQRDVMHHVNTMASNVLLKCMKSYEGNEVFIDDVRKSAETFTDELLRMTKCDANEFNVLNHGDLWVNNIMFQYDAYGKIKETLFVDYQIPRYGTPAQDLYYFLLSSTKFELKLKYFDYFVKYYYDNLVENLTLLKYPKKLPTLRDLHCALYKYGIWGYYTVVGVLAVVLLDPNENASIQNYIDESDAGDKFKMQMYQNPRYRKHMEVVVPWLHNRGVFEY